MSRYSKARAYLRAGRLLGLPLPPHLLQQLQVLPRHRFESVQQTRPALLRGLRPEQDVNGLLVESQTVLHVADVLVLQARLARQRHDLVVQVFGLRGDLVVVRQVVLRLDLAPTHYAHQHPPEPYCIN